MQPQKPTAQHKLLAQFEGSWDTLSEFIIPGQAEPFCVPGVEVARMDMNGFWLRFDLQSGSGPMAFRGHGILGYDPLKQAYVGVWVDQSCGSLQLSEGQADAAGKTFTMLGVMPDYFGQGEQTTRQVSTILDADRKEFSVWRDAPDGSTMRLALIRYTRKR